MMLKISRDDERRESERGLVEHQQPRLAHQRAAHREHLALAAGERSGELIVALLQTRKAPVHLVARRPPTALAGARALKAAELEIVGDAHRGKELASLGNEDEAARHALLDGERAAGAPR